MDAWRRNPRSRSVHTQRRPQSKGEQPSATILEIGLEAPCWGPCWRKLVVYHTYNHVCPSLLWALTVEHWPLDLSPGQSPRRRGAMIASSQQLGNNPLSLALSPAYHPSAVE